MGSGELLSLGCTFGNGLFMVSPTNAPGEGVFGVWGEFLVGGWPSSLASTSLQ